jgi:hypothetical protein
MHPKVKRAALIAYAKVSRQSLNLNDQDKNKTGPCPRCGSVLTGLFDDGSSAFRCCANCEFEEADTMTESGWLDMPWVAEMTADKKHSRHDADTESVGRAS